MEKKKILIVTYYWPPAGGPGVQRWLKFAKYLPEFGWEPIIYTPENPSYPLIDESLLKDVPSDITMVKTPIWEPYQLAEKLNPSNKKYKSGQFDVGTQQSWKSKLSIWVRGNFFIPDARKFWVKPSISFLEKYLQEHQIDVLVTTGPPHSMHLIGLGLKKTLPNLRWIADFRDPWTEISYYKHLKLTSYADKKHKSLEKQVFESADITLATSYTDAENFIKKGANAYCITNGYDADDQVMLPHTSTSKFTLSYIGVLEQLRNPEILWKVLDDLVKENPSFASDFELKIVGKFDDKILEKLRKMSFGTSINNVGYIPHQQAIKEMSLSDILLITNFPEDTSKGIIPGKLFEYLQSGKQILSFGPEEADVKTILEKTQAGKHFAYHDQIELKTYLLQQYKIWKEGDPHHSTTSIEEFSRKNLTQNLSKLLYQFC